MSRLTKRVAVPEVSIPDPSNIVHDGGALNRKTKNKKTNLLALGGITKPAAGN